MNRHTRSLINAWFCPFVIPNAPISLYEFTNKGLFCLLSRGVTIPLFSISTSPGPTRYLMPHTIAIRSSVEHPKFYPPFFHMYISNMGTGVPQSSFRSVFRLIGAQFCVQLLIAYRELRPVRSRRGLLCILPHRSEQHRTLNLDLSIFYHCAF